VTETLRNAKSPDAAYSITSSACCRNGSGIARPSVFPPTKSPRRIALGLFSEVITVTHPGKMIFLAGVGAEDETGARGAIRHLSDVAGQCRYAYDKIKRLLAAHGATMHDVVKVVTYVTDVRFLPDVGKCRTEALEGAPQPVHTFLNINQLAWPGMLVEVDVIAITKAP